MTVWAVGIGIPPAVASDPDIEDRKVVSYGPLDVAVHEVSAAAWPADPDPKLVAMWMAGNSGPPDPSMFYGVSTNGGGTWTDAQLSFPEGDRSAGDPSVGASPDGTFVAALLGVPSGTFQPSLYVTRMLPGSQQFEEARLIELGGFDFPRLVTGPGPGPGGEPYFYIVLGGLKFTRSTDLGMSWLDVEPLQVNGENVTGWAPAPAVRPDNGTIYVAYGYGVTPDPSFLRLVESTDNGDSFSHLAGLNEPIKAIDLRYDDFVPGTFNIPGFARMAIDPSDPDRLYLVFNDLYDEPLENPVDGDVDVYLMRSTDGGQTWLPRQRINQDRLYDPQDPDWTDHVLFDQFMPEINVDSAGRVHIIWYDTRKDHPAADDPQPFDIELYYAWSTDNGQTFTEELIGKAIDTADLLQPGFIGDYNALTSAGDLVIPVYMGTRDPEALPPWQAPGGPKQLDETTFSNRILH